MTDGIGYLASIALASVFIYSGVAKLRDGHSTRRALSAAKVRGGGVLAKIVPMAELAVAATLVVRPSLGGIAALVLLSVFSLFVVSLLVRRIDVSCGCFGANANRPVSWADLLRNLLLVLAAVVASTAAGPSSVAIEELMAVSTAIAIAIVALVAVETRRELGQLFDNRLPGER